MVIVKLRVVMLETLIIIYINTGSIFVLGDLSSVFLAVIEVHVPRPVMIIHCLIILKE
jgi:hypothetical protein